MSQDGQSGDLTAEVVQSQVGAIVKELLGRHIDRDENFFEAGFDSLTVTKLHTLMVKRLGTRIPVMALFSYPNLRQIAELVVAAAEGPAPGREIGTRVRRTAASRREIRSRLRDEDSGR